MGQKWPYVYALEDPRDGSVFYIGKGTGRRMYQHECDAKRGKVYNAIKTERIKSILAAGMKVTCRVIAEYGCDADAYQGEKDAIAAHEALTNANSGGGGGFSGYEKIAVTLRKTEDLIARTKPYMDWVNERPRSNEENAWYHAIVAELRQMREMCLAGLNPHVAEAPCLA